ncbi:hypothetical protein F4803DRAFT_545909 [Xylaria telfairii]|nr:hypothetical protein F4803DRAFT_545909 [Xylaria telfairii]
MSAGHLKTGTPGTYNDGDGHNYSRKAIRDEQRHHLQKAEGYKPKSQNHAMDAMLGEDIQALVEERYKTDPLYSATMHGNRPSKGARQDAEIQADEAEMIRKKQEKMDSLTGKKLEHKMAREH